MGICQFCHRSAGLFRSAHRECLRRFEQARQQLLDLLRGCFEERREVSAQHERIMRLCREGHLDEAALGAACAEALDAAILRYLRVGPISPEENELIARFIDYTGLPQSLLNAHHSLERLVQAQILRDLLAGSPPQCRLTTEGDIPVELQAGETLLWLAGNVLCCRQELPPSPAMRPEMPQEGGSRQGAPQSDSQLSSDPQPKPQSDGPTPCTCTGEGRPMGRGIYYPADCCDAPPPDEKELQPLGQGLAALSDKALYFASPTQQLRLSYAELTEVLPCRAGVSFREGKGESLLFFSGLDPWFCLNLAANLMRPAARAAEAGAPA